MIKLIFKIIAFVGIGALPTAGAFGQAPIRNVTTVQSVNLERYAGKWFEIGKYPNKFQKKCIGNTSATYSLKSNGRIEVRNECLLKDGKVDIAVGEAKVADTKTNAKLKVRFAPGALSFLPFVWGNYWIIDLDKDYSYVAIGEPKREYFWILSRNPTLDDKTYQMILRRAEAMGFNPSKVEKTPQNVEVLKGTVVVKQ